MTTVDDLFQVESGEGEYRKHLDEGDTPIISATTEDNGVMDLVDIEPTFEAPAITVERVTGKAFVQVEDFATVPDDMAVLKPKVDMSLKDLFHIASQINSHRWKFSYSRKLTPTRLAKIEVEHPHLEEGTIDDVLESLDIYLPESEEPRPVKRNPENWEMFNVTELFDLKRGDFHSLSRLEEGDMPTVSRVAEDNGIVGYYEPPEDAEIYRPGLITVSSVTGKAFVQLQDFIATDNVVICEPHEDYSLTTLIFMQQMIDYVNWRYSYGRQCYKTKFSKTDIYLPVDGNGDLDTKYMAELVENTSYWSYMKKESDFQRIKLEA